VSLRSYTLLSVETLATDTRELTYSVQLKPKASEPLLLDAVREIDGCESVSLVTGLQNMNV
jgi:hypothetical protein